MPRYRTELYTTQTRASPSKPFLVSGTTQCLDKKTLRCLGNGKGTLVNSSLLSAPDQSFLGFLTFEGDVCLDDNLGFDPKTVQCTPHMDTKFKEISSEFLKLSENTAANQKLETDPEFGFCLIPSELEGSSRQKRKKVKAITVSVTEYITSLAISWIQKINSTPALTHLLPFSKLLKSLVYPLQIVGSVFEVVDLLASLNTLISANRLQKETFKSFNTFQGSWNKLLTALKLAKFTYTFSSNLNINQLVHWVRGQLCQAVLDCKSTGLKILSNLDQDLARLVASKDTRCGMLIELAFDMLCGFLLPSPLIFVSVARFLLEYEIDYVTTRIMSYIRCIRRCLSFLDGLLTHPLFHKSNEDFPNCDGIEVIKLAIRLVQDHVPQIPQYSRLNHLSDILKTVWEKIVQIFQAAKNVVNLVVSGARSLASFMQDFLKNPHHYITKAKTFLVDQFELFRNFVYHYSFRDSAGRLAKSIVKTICSLMESINKFGWGVVCMSFMGLKKYCERALNEVVVNCKYIAKEVAEKIVKVGCQCKTVLSSVKEWFLIWWSKLKRVLHNQNTPAREQKQQPNKQPHYGISEQHLQNDKELAEKLSILWNDEQLAKELDYQWDHQREDEERRLEQDEQFARRLQQQLIKDEAKEQEWCMKKQENFQHPNKDEELAHKLAQQCEDEQLAISLQKRLQDKFKKEEELRYKDEELAHKLSQQYQDEELAMSLQKRLQDKYEKEEQRRYKDEELAHKLAQQFHDEHLAMSFQKEASKTK